MLRSTAALVVLLVSLLSRPTLLVAQIRDVRVSLLYDNTTTRGDLTPDWGFACLVQCDERTFLFDTGAKPEVLQHNMAALRVDQSRIEAITLSHEHADHVSGISAFNRKSIPMVYAPRLARIYERTSEALRNAAVDIVEVSEMLEIAPFISISKPLGGICFEQALVIDTWNGLVVIVGCAHPGIVAMLNAIIQSTGRPIHALVGGLHLVDSPPAGVDRVIADLEALGVEKACPCHCTGEAAIRAFKTAFRDNFLDGGVGSVIRISAGSNE